MGPLLFVGIFLAASFLMVWRLEAMAAYGMEGTVLGTLIMPYCTGMGNLIFAVVLGRHGGAGADVLTNCLVNNITNLTLLVGLPAALWGMAVLPKKAKAPPDYSHHLDRISMLLTLLAVLFFTGVAWALGRRQEIGITEGLGLAGLFLAWQAFNALDAVKNNRRKHKSMGWKLPVDLILLLGGSCLVYLSTEWLVTWLSNIKTGFISARHLGWLSGWLDVLPNGALAFYYGWKRQAAVVYTSQVGDGHICIPLCIGIFALFKPIQVPPFFETGALILGAVTVVHLGCVGVWGKLPRAVGWLLTAAYVVFLCQGLG
jgi:cation:H+ antiporter